MVKKYHSSFLDPTRHEGFIGIYEDDTLIATCNTPADAQRLIKGLHLVQAMELNPPEEPHSTERVKCLNCGKILKNEINTLMKHSRGVHHEMWGSYSFIEPEEVKPTTPQEEK